MIMIKETYFCLVVQFETMNEQNFFKIYENEVLNAAIRKNFFKFYNKLDTTKFKMVLVDIKKILRKCVYFKIPESNQAWVSPCINLDDHD